MLTTLPRHVLLDVLKTFLVALTGLTALFVIGIVARQAASEGIPLTHVARLVPYVIPESLRYALPATLLLAATTVYSKLAGNNEIVAIKAMGISPWAVIWPVLVMAFLLSLLTVWINDVAVSWGRPGAKRVVIGAVEDIAYALLRSKKTYSSPKLAISVQKVDDRRLIMPTCTINTQPPLTITAEEAKLQCDHEAEKLRIGLRDGEMEQGGDDARKLVFSGWEYFEIPIFEASRTRQRPDNPSETPLAAIPEEIVIQNERIAQCDREMGARAALALSLGQFDDLADSEWEVHRAWRRDMVKRLNRLYTEPHRRWAAGFSCFCFVWLGIPVAIRRRRSDFLSSFFVCFAPILVVYYPLLMFGADAAKNGLLPPWCVWVGNAVFLVVGGMLMRGMLRR